MASATITTFHRQRKSPRFGGAFPWEATIADIFTWSATPGSNTLVDGINIAEGCPAGNVNNALRSIMALVVNTFASGLSTFFTGATALPIANGGTAATTDTAARTALSAAKLGANSDITSLAGLTTALSIPQGGTGATTGQTAVAALTGQTGTAPFYAARAWVKFSGTTGVIAASGNVSSITVNGTGDYTVNFTTAMPDADYAMTGTVKTDGTAVSGDGSTVTIKRIAGAQAAGSCRVQTCQDNGLAFACEAVTVVFFR